VPFLGILLTFPVHSRRSFFRLRFFRYRGRPPPRSFTSFLPSWRSTLSPWASPLSGPLLSLGPGPLIPDDVPVAPCHSYTKGHPPAGGSQLPPGSTIFWGQFLWFSTSPCSYMPALVPLLHCSRRFHFRRDLPMEVLESMSSEFSFLLSRHEDRISSFKPINVLGVMLYDVLQDTIN
jgi:hypothetical protein